MNTTIAILVNYNNSRDTIEAVNSLQKQTVPLQKILITDNNSSDNSVRILQKEFPDDNVVILHSKENRGFASGNNLAIKYALENIDFDYILIINNDTISDENLNKNFIEYYENHDSESIGILTGKILNYYKPEYFLSAGGKYSSTKCSGYHIGDGEKDVGQYDETRECSFATACLWFFHKSLITRIGYLPEEYFLYLEDVDYCLQVIKAGMKIIYLPTVKILHKEGSSTKITKKTPNFYYTNRNRIICAKKHLPKSERLRFYVFFFLSRIFRFFQFLFLGKPNNTFKGIKEGFAFNTKNKVNTLKHSPRNTLKKLIAYTINIPTYLLSHLFKKDKNLWIIGAWYGQSYSDNSKYLFEYIKANHPEIKAIWLSQNLDVLKEIRSKGFKAYSTFSFSGYLHSFKASVAVVTHSKLTDLNFYAISPETKIIQMWHGIPLKKIYYDDEKSAQKLREKSSKTKELIFPFLKERFDLMITTSAEFQEIAGKAFRMPKEKIKVTGYPRNDVFFNKSKKLNNKKKIIYLPTLRNEIGSEIDLFFQFGFAAEHVSDVLERNNAELYLMLHPANRFEQKFTDIISKFQNIIILQECDIYESISDYDILITDFSSILFDFLLIGKPIIFTVFDKDEYIRNERDLYYYYDEITPGAKTKNWEETIEFALDIFAGNDEYKMQREKIRSRFFKYSDGRNSERVFHEISALIHTKKEK
jgi:CDP-glycerol glycerophosphotransferase